MCGHNISYAIGLSTLIWILPGWLPLWRKHCDDDRNFDLESIRFEPFLGGCPCDPNIVVMAGTLIWNQLDLNASCHSEEVDTWWTHSHLRMTHHHLRILLPRDGNAHRNCLQSNKKTDPPFCFRAGKVRSIFGVFPDPWTTCSIVN